jgi:hypothetical protein
LKIITFLAFFTFGLYQTQSFAQSCVPSSPGASPSIVAACAGLSTQAACLNPPPSSFMNAGECNWSRVQAGTGGGKYDECIATGGSRTCTYPGGNGCRYSSWTPTNQPFSLNPSQQGCNVNNGMVMGYISGSTCCTQVN